MTDTYKSDREDAGARRRDKNVRADIDTWFVQEVLPLEAVLTQYLRRNWRDKVDVADFLQDIYLRIYEAASKDFPKSTKSRDPLI
jgi:DNA-directed RNA polymerase specialized sigma24 family protein